MKLSERAKLNKFRNLLDGSRRADMNSFRFTGTSKKHSERVSTICHALYYDIKTPFFTEVKFYNGYKPDIVAPLYLGGTIIEVRHSETEKQSKAKQVPEELQDFVVIYSDCDKPFELKDIQ